MSLVPNRFLFRLAHPCRYIKDLPREDDRLLDLPEACRVEAHPGLDGRPEFADVRLAWNELGLAVQVEVRGKENVATGSAAHPQHADGLTLWIDTRDARASHRASRYCHQFSFLPTGGGPERDEPVFAQTKINRALHDAPPVPASAVAFRAQSKAGGYVLEAFLTAAALHGFDPEQNRRLGITYVVRDAERGEQFEGAGPEFPFREDPSLWSVLELTR